MSLRGMFGTLVANVLEFSIKSHTLVVKLIVVPGSEVLFTYELFPPKFLKSIWSVVMLNSTATNELFP